MASELMNNSKVTVNFAVKREQNDNAQVTTQSDSVMSVNMVNRLVGWLVGWFDSGAPTFVIWHHSLIQY